MVRLKQVVEGGVDDAGIMRRIGALQPLEDPFRFSAKSKRLRDPASIIEGMVLDQFRERGIRGRLIALGEVSEGKTKAAMHCSEFQLGFTQRRVRFRAREKDPARR